MSLDSTTFVQYGPLSGTLPIGMRAGADQAAVTTTAATSTTPFGFGAAAQADAIVAAVSHKAYLSMPQTELLAKLKPGGVFVDVKSAYDPSAITASGFKLWRL